MSSPGAWVYTPSPITRIPFQSSLIEVGSFHAVCATKFGLDLLLDAVGWAGSTVAAP